MGVAWLALVTVFPCFGSVGQETVDGILAVVNQDVITLTDFRIVMTFGLYRRDAQTDSMDSPREVLDRLIDQKLILGMTNPDFTVHENELEAKYQSLVDALGLDALRREMTFFDLNREGLYAYIRDAILFNRVLEQRFQLAVTVGLREIEAYYNQTYVPQRRAEGSVPQPMVEILPQLEAAVKAEGARSLIQEWARNLRKEANIQVFTDRFPQFFQR
jgi:hypothetical protein